MNKSLIKIIAIVIVVGAGSFYGGMKYGQSSNSASNVQNLSAEQRQQLRGGVGGTGRRAGAQPGGEFINGDIISKDDKSITVKLRDGGSKIIFFSTSTSIGKTTTGVAGDLEVGKQVTVNGSANSDGSVTAQNIQIRPIVPVNK